MPTSISDPAAARGPTAAERARADIEADAAAAGFGAVRVVRAADFGALHGARLAEAVTAGHHGDMEWLADTAARRASPQALWPDVRSVIMLAMNYGPRADPLADLTRRDRGVVSVYARGRDYHDVIKGRLKGLAQRLVARHGGDVKVFVDTAPVMEKPLAMEAGIGWQGKHTNLVSRDFGSWLFLGSIFTTLDLAPDAPARDHCGSCRRCLDICPTDAFPAPYRLDARRCLAFLTVESREMIPLQFRRAMGNRIFGCDDCLAVCPWNRFAKVASEVKLSGEDEPAPLAELAALGDEAFRKRYAGTPVKRLGRERFVRNVMVACGNARDAALAPSIVAATADEAPQVRAAAVWAASESMDAEDFRALRVAREPHEGHQLVKLEWARGDACRR
ncbi:tRNA epoxyqueuosine(34) reductase QueG [Acuticoccus yangtzensis]|uniref:tRNA epoxyqueuosine(34) reductase QueG n=1 Tax=Acuticoccus yangtzensis TaxID=1443441 RepID=UPI0009499703|nr:tRNA epoxyqueuosine(34) reductase QueG [Acuticoccus yangtzensis]